MTRLSRLRRRLRATSPTDQALRIALGLMLLSGAVAGTSASFNASTDEASASSLGTDSLIAPASLTASASGNSVVLTWPTGAMGSGQATFGHRIREANVGVESGTRDGQDPPTCSTATTFTATTGNTTNSGLTLTDSGVATGTTHGSWMCYQVETQYPQGASPTWLSQTNNKTAVVQIGNVLRSMQFVDGPNTSSGTLGNGDQIVFTFTQPISTSTGPANTNNTGGTPTSGQSICTRTGQELNIGRTAFNGCANSETNWVGTVTGVTMGSNAAWHTAWAWSDCPVANQCRMLTATLGSSYSGSATSTITNVSSGVVAPTTTSGKLTSASGSVAICSSSNTTTSTCRPTPFGTV
jgi:hypothetical protein